tara:strand:- start:213 stop:635 length:423 start_codon:yes stop_codon:yes gene_type:complete
MQFSFLRNSIILLSLFYSFSTFLYADFFKWELLVSEKGYGTESLTIPIVAEGKIDLLDELFICKMRNFWTKIESEILLEGKTIECLQDNKKIVVSLICRDNNKNRKYNKNKELYPFAKDGLRLKPELGADSPYLELRCYF